MTSTYINWHRNPATALRASETFTSLTRKTAQKELPYQMQGGDILDGARIADLNLVVDMRPTKKDQMRAAKYLTDDPKKLCDIYDHLMEREKEALLKFHRKVSQSCFRVGYDGIRSIVTRFSLDRYQAEALAKMVFILR